MDEIRLRQIVIKELNQHVERLLDIAESQNINPEAAEEVRDVADGLDHLVSAIENSAMKRSPPELRPIRARNRKG